VVLLLKYNSAKVAAKPNSHPSTLTSTNWTCTLNPVNSIPSGFFTNWNKMSFITKSDKTSLLTESLTKTNELEIILEDNVIE
jgi:hypothetical protein